MKSIFKIMEGLTITYFFTVFVIFTGIEILSILIMEEGVKSYYSSTFMEEWSFYFILAMILFLFIRTYHDYTKYSKVMLSAYIISFTLSIIFTLITILLSLLFEIDSYVKKGIFSDFTILILVLLLFIFTVNKLKQIQKV
ncbi:hypothetical protein FIU87_10020 [Bacillus sp. THAF10]|uniref:hypothetical protein n=1 Tax=Bacillus sp. THAF10 TaxID=2587848 RepID=UPI0012684935|nr:hypothetical protein [Bacillus sp. THAF10]QFT88982.1 hypothetical protein FIU87_10020 [Bacillus sp. THAF10]